MATDGAKHAFISYVKEDKDQVDRLCRLLDAAGIPYWRDRKDLAPGDAWKQTIRDAIRSGSLIFLACFSESSRERSKSYMNEELTLAAEEFRMRPPGATWLIPVRFDDGPVPHWDLGAGRTLEDLNYSDLFGEAYAENGASLVTTINRVMGALASDPSTTRASVEELTGADRRVSMRRLTKDMILDPARRIELDDLIGDETRRVLDAMRNDARFSVDALPGSNDEQIVAVVNQAQAYWELIEPFCWSLQVAARWAEPETLAPWVSALRSITRAGTKMTAGKTVLIELRTLPALCAMFTGALAAVAQNRWDNLRALVIDATVAGDNGAVLPLVDILDPFAPFRANDLIPNTFARSAIENEKPATALEAFTTGKTGKYHTPVDEWIFHVLHAAFDSQLSEHGEFEAAFNATEVFLGILSQDLANQKVVAGEWVRRPHWYGRATWARRYGPDPVSHYANELESNGSGWPPLLAGLFGGDHARATVAIAKYKESFDAAANGRW